MGNHSTRLMAEKQRVLGQVLEELGQDPGVRVALLNRLLERGYEVRMLGGDRIWWAGEDPPTAEEIRSWRQQRSAAEEENRDPLDSRRARGSVSLKFYDWAELVRLIDDEEELDEDRLRFIRHRIREKMRDIRKRFRDG